MGAERINRVEEMPAYQLFYKLALDVERTSREYHSDFRWLRNQSLRSSESVCANMTEGFYAQYSTEYLQSLYRCRREARESLMHITYAKDVGQLAAEAKSMFSTEYEDALQQLGNLISSIERKLETYGKSKPGISYVKEDMDFWGPENHQPSPIDHQPSTINHQPSTINH